MPQRKSHESDSVTEYKQDWTDIILTGCILQFGNNLVIFTRETETTVGQLVYYQRFFQFFNDTLFDAIIKSRFWAESPRTIKPGTQTWRI